ncbi:MAG: hypothetical protein FGM27_00125 [Candidatus Omnitrophica bacterium]|nr:hypothetical protein [Candidatus Omnitrophota bacterium]
MKLRSALLAVMLCMTLTTPRLLASEDVWDLAESEQYGKKSAGMVGRGLINAATSPVDLVVQTVESTQEGPPFFGTLTGLSSGLGCTALRASSGIMDVATFWVPGFNGFKVSRSYSNCLEAEYTKARYTPVREPQTQVIEQPQVVVVQEPAKPVVVQAPNPMDYVKKGDAPDPMAYVKKGSNENSYVK